MKRANKVIIFGGSGFLGRYIIDELIKKNFYVVNFDKQKIPFKYKKLSFIKGDIKNYKLVEKAIKGSKYVINLAGISDIGVSLKKPVETVKTNILGTINILEACKKFKIKKHIFASTVYVLSSQGGFYRTSKHSGELYIQEYKKRYNLNFTIIRYGSIYGEGASNKNGITKIIYHSLKKGELKYTGTKRAVRSFIHAKDAARLTLKTLSNKYSNKSILITGSSKVRIMDLMKYLKKKLGIQKKLVYSNKTELGHYDRNPYSYKKIKNKTLKPRNNKNFKNNLDKLIKYLKNEQIR
tara:strand:- start:1447 stop:2331 length:885 start_codon:yes stop_codon:yes gene_type:complete